MLNKINQLLKEPEILLEKPLIACAVGAAFLVIGILSLTVMRDLVFFLMSLFIAAYSVFISIRLFRKILDKTYLVLEGKCIESTRIGFSGMVRVGIEDIHEGEVYCRLRRKMAAQFVKGRCYRIYFMELQTAAGKELSQDHYWCMEEI